MPKRKLRLVCVPDARPQRYHTFKKLPSRYSDVELVASEIAGDSLADADIARGSIVAVAKGGAVSSGDLVAVKLFDEPDGYLVRFLFLGPGGWIRLQTADRDEWPDRIYAPGESEIIGPVIPSRVPLAAMETPDLIGQRP